MVGVRPVANDRRGMKKTAMECSGPIYRLDHDKPIKQRFVLANRIGAFDDLCIQHGPIISKTDMHVVM